MTTQALTLSLLVPLTACTVKREASIAGTYTLKAPCVTATLLVNRDHSFIQTVRTDAGAMNRLKGVWSIDREGFVYFRPILSLKETAVGQAVGGLASKVEWSLDGLRIGPEIVKCGETSHEVDYFQSE